MTKANNSFAVVIPGRDTDPNLFYKQNLLKEIAAKYPNFTISGKNPPVVTRGVEHAGYGNLLTFGTAKTHDIEWVERVTYACEKGYAPIYDLVKDWDKIMDRLGKLYEERYPSRFHVSNGMEVEFFKNFVKIGYNRVDYKDLHKYGVTNLSVLFNIILTKDDIAALYFATRG